MDFSSLIIVLLAALTFSTNGEYTYNVGYFNQPVDHFSFKELGHFRMKYLWNPSHWTGNGAPIFFYPGNEGSIELFAQNTGFIWEAAEEFGALVLFTEERYYGESLPFGNLSYTRANIVYLTSEQILADYAEFLDAFKASIGADRSPVIAFGGSYGGMLAAWMRIRYPHLIQGAIASSAPLLIFPGVYKDCGAVERDVTRMFARESEECADTIRKSWGHLNALAKTVEGRSLISNEWKLCRPLTQESDVRAIKSWIVGLVAYLSMSNYPYPTDFVISLPGYPVREFCSGLRNPSAPAQELLSDLFQATTVYFNHTGDAQCLDTNHISSPLLQHVPWSFQSCMELAMPQCTDGIQDFYEPATWNLDAYMAGCKALWGVYPKPYQAEILYGARQIKDSSNIIFSNGLLDIWNPVAFTETISQSKDLVAINIEDAAHHLDLRASHPADPPSVIKARNTEKVYIKKWINAYKI